MPTPTDAHRKLDKLVGTWIAEEWLSPSPWDPNGGTAIGRVTNVAALAGFAVVQDYEQERRGRVNFRGHGIFRWDQALRSYVLHWFDSMGLAPTEFRGTFEGDVLTLSASGPQGASRAVWDFSHPGACRYRMEVSPDGVRWFTSMQGVYTRQP